MTNLLACIPEKERINALKKYNILDTPPDGSFDHITKLAATLLNVPIAIVTLVDTDRIWFKSRYGLDVYQIGRDPGLCASAILSNEVYEVEDAISDPRTLANPLVAGGFGLRFYAAAPLTVKDGYNLGTLCVIDKQPRKLSPAQKELLNSLAEILIDQIELRLAARTAIYKQNQLLSVAAHDLKSPLTTIVIMADMIKIDKTNEQTVEKMSEKIKDTCGRMNRKVTHLLDSASREAGNIQLKFSRQDFANIIEQITTLNQVQAANKNIKLHVNIISRPEINGEEEKVAEIADNLINNAIKYSPKHKNIHIIVSEKNGKAILKVADEGQGFTKQDKENMFQRFARLSSQPTGGESSTGLGLSIVKVLVEAHGGTISVESTGKDEGATFTVEIPVCDGL